MVAGVGFEPTSVGHEPTKEPLLYPAISRQPRVFKAFWIDALASFSSLVMKYGRERGTWTLTSEDYGGWLATIANTPQKYKTL